MNIRILFIVLSVLAANAIAVESVRVLALFPNKAMLQIDGKRKVMSVGKSYRDVTLIEANPNFAIVEFNGKQREIRLGSAVNASFVQKKRTELRLLSDSGRSFYTTALINGQSMRMLVDTGATSVAMSELHAKKLGIAYLVEGKRTGVRTASGTAVAFEVKLKSIKLGEVILNNVSAVVVQGNSPVNMLLGMNVLSQFEMEHKGQLLILRTKF